MPVVDNEEPEIPQFQVSQNVIRSNGVARTQNNTIIETKPRQQLPNI